MSRKKVFNRCLNHHLGRDVGLLFGFLLFGTLVSESGNRDGRVSFLFGCRGWRYCSNSGLCIAGSG